MPATKITKALAKRLSAGKGAAVRGVAFAAIDSEKLPLSSFAARASARDREVKEKLSTIMARIGEWEKSSGQSAEIAVRPVEAAVAITAPPALFESLAEEDAVAALDVDAA